ncbi:MAG: hypothetical protein D6712_07690 [Chloroflexi bacterium]|nr:MAG: hypothetical protein D6712_07690 [Chloroflexota bacterium]
MEPGERARAFKAEVQQKIQKLLEDFASGQLSQAQFDIIYERYHSQLILAEYAVESGKDAAVDIARSGPSTISLKEAAKGKATGIAIYHISGQRMIETLGDFAIPEDILEPMLQDLMRQISTGNSPQRYVERIASRYWLLFTIGRHTISITLFHNEPSPIQLRETQRLHQDFEAANSILLADPKVEANRLAFPFRVFIRQQFGGPPQV